MVAETSAYMLYDSWRLAKETKLAFDITDTQFDCTHGVKPSAVVFDLSAWLSFSAEHFSKDFNLCLHVATTAGPPQPVSGAFLQHHSSK